MIQVKLLNHKNQDVYTIGGREEGTRFFKDISKDGIIVDPVEVFKGVSIKSEGEEISMIMSDALTDRDDERVLTDGWDLSYYMKNPILLWAHEWDRPAIGYMKNLRVVDSLAGTPVFVDKTIDHFGWSIGEKIKMGILSAGSVGMFPKQWKFIDDPEDDAWLEIEKQELLEFSICNVPANPRALVERAVIDYPYKRLDTIEDMLKALTEELSHADNGVKRTAIDILGAAASTVKK